MEKIKIPRDLLDEFSNGHHTSENGSASDGIGSQAAIKSLEKSLAWLIKVGDEFAKERDLPGIGKMSNAELAELATIVLERNLGSEFMERSPEYMLGTIGTLIVTSNVVALKRQQVQSETDTDEQEDEKY